MTYRVVWLNRAIAQLTAIYVSRLELGAGAGAVVRAAARVDQVLAPNPLAAGESRAGNERSCSRGR